MRRQWTIYLGIALLAGAAGSSFLGPAPANAVNRDMVELQESITQLVQSQQTLQTAISQDDAVQKSLLGQTADSINKLNGSLTAVSGTMSGLQKALEDLQATSGARLDSMSTQVQGVSDNLQEAMARLGHINQQLTDTQNAIQAVDAKIATPAPTAPPLPAPNAAPPVPQPGTPPVPSAGAAAPATPGPSAAAPPAAVLGAPPVAAPAPAASVPAQPSADLLYSNGLRDLNGRKYELANEEFRDYLKYYSDTDLASNAQFYLGEIAFAQDQFQDAVSDYSIVIDKYPRSFKLAPAHLKKGLALLALNQKSAGIRELQTVVRQYPGTDEERRARAKLHEVGAS